MAYHHVNVTDASKSSEYVPLACIATHAGGELKSLELSPAGSRLVWTDGTRPVPALLDACITELIFFARRGAVALYPWQTAPSTAHQLPRHGYILALAEAVIQASSTAGQRVMKCLVQWGAVSASDAWPSPGLDMVRPTLLQRSAEQFSQQAQAAAPLIPDAAQRASVRKLVLGTPVLDDEQYLRDPPSLPAACDQLHPHQRASVVWMLQREQRDPAATSDYPLVFPVTSWPLWLEAQGGAWRMGACVLPGAQLFCDPVHTCVSTEHPHVHAVSGGICAHDTGLGKTYICLSLVLAAPHPARPMLRDWTVPDLSDANAAPAVLQCAQAVWKAGLQHLDPAAEVPAPDMSYIPTEQLVHAAAHAHMLGREGEAMDGATALCSLATLIVLPGALIHQWCAESHKWLGAAPGACVVDLSQLTPARVARAIQQVHHWLSQPVGAAGSARRPFLVVILGSVYPDMPADVWWCTAAIITLADLVLTSFSHAQRGLDYNGQTRGRRAGVEYATEGALVPPAHIKSVLFWRIAMDEAEKAKVGTPGKLAQAMKQIQAWHTWCVTATPMNHKDSDLLGILRFLNDETWANPAVWRSVLQPILRQPAADQAAVAMALGILQPMLRRHTKASTEAALGLPELTLVDVHTCLGPAEEDIYRSAVQAVAAKAPHPAAMGSTELQALAPDVTALRRAACHPEMESRLHVFDGAVDDEQAVLQARAQAGKRRKRGRARRGQVTTIHDLTGDAATSAIDVLQGGSTVTPVDTRGSRSVYLPGSQAGQGADMLLACAARTPQELMTMRVAQVENIISQPTRRAIALTQLSLAQWHWLQAHLYYARAAALAAGESLAPDFTQPAWLQGSGGAVAHTTPAGLARAHAWHARQAEAWARSGWGSLQHVEIFRANRAQDLAALRPWKMGEARAMLLLLKMFHTQGRREDASELITRFRESLSHDTLYADQQHLQAELKLVDWHLEESSKATGAFMLMPHAADTQLLPALHAVARKCAARRARGAALELLKEPVGTVAAAEVTPVSGVAGLAALRGPRAAAQSQLVHVPVHVYDVVDGQLDLVPHEAGPHPLLGLSEVAAKYYQLIFFYLNHAALYIAAQRVIDARAELGAFASRALAGTGHAGQYAAAKAAALAEVRAVCAARWPDAVPPANPRHSHVSAVLHVLQAEVRQSQQAGGASATASGSARVDEDAPRTSADAQAKAAKREVARAAAALAPGCVRLLKELQQVPAVELQQLLELDSEAHAGLQQLIAAARSSHGVRCVEEQDQGTALKALLTCSALGTAVPETEPAASAWLAVRNIWPWPQLRAVGGIQRYADAGSAQLSELALLMEPSAEEDNDNPSEQAQHKRTVLDAISAQLVESNASRMLVPELDAEGVHMDELEACEELGLALRRASFTALECLAFEGRNHDHVSQFLKDTVLKVQAVYRSLRDSGTKLSSFLVSTLVEFYAKLQSPIELNVIAESVQALDRTPAECKLAQEAYRVALRAACGGVHHLLVQGLQDDMHQAIEVLQQAPEEPVVVVDQDDQAVQDLTADEPPAPEAQPAQPPALQPQPSEDDSSTALFPATVPAEGTTVWRLDPRLLLSMAAGLSIAGSPAGLAGCLAVFGMMRRPPRQVKVEVWDWLHGHGPAHAGDDTGLHIGASTLALPATARSAAQRVPQSVLGAMWDAFEAWTPGTSATALRARSASASQASSSWRDDDLEWAEFLAGPAEHPAIATLLQPLSSSTVARLPAIAAAAGAVPGAASGTARRKMLSSLLQEVEVEKSTLAAPSEGELVLDSQLFLQQVSMSSYPANGDAFACTGHSLAAELQAWLELPADPLALPMPGLPDHVAGQPMLSIEPVVGAAGIALLSTTCALRARFAAAWSQLAFLRSKRDLLAGESYQCPVCRATLCWVDSVLPALLPCGHTLCADCESGWRAARRAAHSTPACPECKVPYKPREIFTIDRTRGGALGQEVRVEVQGAAATSSRGHASALPASMAAANAQQLDPVVDRYGTKAVAIVRRILALPEADKVLVFTQWPPMQALLSAALVGTQTPHAILRGSERARTRALAAFRATEPGNSVRVLIALTTVDAAGLTLVEANHVILADPLSDSGAETQCVGRVHRMGQSKRCWVWRMVADSTVEPAVIPARHAVSLAGPGFQPATAGAAASAGQKRRRSSPFGQLAKQQDYASEHSAFIARILQEVAHLAAAPDED